MNFTLEITDFDSLLPALIPAIIPGAIGGLFGLIGLILIIAGRKDYGEKHSKFTIYALILFITSIIIRIVLSVLQSFFTYSSVSSLSFLNQSISFDFSNMLLTMAIQMIISAILSGLMYLFLLYHLENRSGRYILFAAVFTSIFFGFVIAIYNYLNLSELFTTIDFESSSTSFGTMINYIFNLSKISIVGLIGNILLVIAIYIPYKRINSGELVAILPSHLKRCKDCGRVSKSDYTICPYCGKQYFDNK